MVILYKDGLALVKGKISTGKPGFDTPPGHYLVTDKERERRSSIYKVSMPYFLSLSFSEYGIHEGHDPGRPASHGCIRVAEENVAKAIFDQPRIGTVVDIDYQPPGFGFKLPGRRVSHVSNGRIVSAACLVVINKNMPAT